MSEPLSNSRAVRMMLALLFVIGVAIGVGMVRGDHTLLAQRADASGNPADVQAPVSGSISSAPGTHHRVYSEPRGVGRSATCRSTSQPAGVPRCIRVSGSEGLSNSR